ncbi:DsbC family protein [Massilia sp. erpn]|uniref:DsbC family protein n=1 Tax=Massilia sp. erpn TaxID=2738142 RepID=UPI002103CD1E|nr:DsbC family protein [Massilia sp. erpn]UTY55855.1 DsbC family protein [Massilia sp. erpn]
MERTTMIKAAVRATLFAAGLAQAGPIENEIIRNVGPLLNNMPIEKVIPSDRAGLYEVLTPRGLVYTDRTGSFVLFNGVMIDSKTKVNLTERRMDALIKVDFADFPLKDAVKTVKGDGSRLMVTFEDPNCGYCKKLMGEFNKLDNVTIYTFLIPILSPDSATKAKAIWCAPDPAKAWTDFMGKNTPLPSQVAASCETPLDRNLALSRKLHIMGTPAIFFKNAPKEKGFATADQIEAKLK